MPAKEPLAKLIFGPMAALIVGEKCSRTQVRSAFSPPRALPSNKILSFASGSCGKFLVSGSETKER